MSDSEQCSNPLQHDLISLLVNLPCSTIDIGLYPKLDPDITKAKASRSIQVVEVCDSADEGEGRVDTKMDWIEGSMKSLSANHGSCNDIGSRGG